MLWAPKVELDAAEKLLEILGVDAARNLSPPVHGVIRVPPPRLSFKIVQVSHEQRL
jgi:hypothetical protein